MPVFICFFGGRANRSSFAELKVIREFYANAMQIQNNARSPAARSGDNHHPIVLFSSWSYHFNTLMRWIRARTRFIEQQRFRVNGDTTRNTPDAVADHQREGNRSGYIILVSFPQCGFGQCPPARPYRRRASREPGARDVVSDGHVSEPARHRCCATGRLSAVMIWDVCRHQQNSHAHAAQEHCSSNILLKELQHRFPSWPDGPDKHRNFGFWRYPS